MLGHIEFPTFTRLSLPPSMSSKSSLILSYLWCKFSHSSPWWLPSVVLTTKQQRQFYFIFSSIWCTSLSSFFFLCVSWYVLLFILATSQLPLSSYYNPSSWLSNNFTLNLCEKLRSHNIPIGLSIWDIYTEHIVSLLGEYPLATWLQFLIS